MKRRIALYVVAAAAAVSGPLAQAEIVKCVDSKGHVTLTDLPCNGSAFLVQQTGSSTGGQTGSSAEAATLGPEYYREPAAPPDPLRVGAVRIHLSPSEFGPSGSAKARFARMTRPAPSQTFTVDTATLRAAHTTLAMPAVQGAQVAAR